MMVVDTSALLAYFDAAESKHEVVRSVVESERGLLVVSPYVVAELDYLVLSRYGVNVELAVLQELTSGAWELASFSEVDLAEATRIVEKFADEKIGVADASNVVLANRHGTETIATLDKRHYSVLRFPNNKPVKILP